MAPQRSRAEVPADPRDLPGVFAHRHLVEVRLADTDAMGHVNNARYLTYTEIARVDYYQQVIGKPLPLGVHGAEEGMILADIRVAYRSPSVFGEALTVETRTERVGNTSLTQVHRITAPESRYGETRLVGVAEAVLVAYDYAAERPIPVPAEWRAAIVAFEGWDAA